MSIYKVICFDMDGTLITNTNSVEYLCAINNKLDEVKGIDDQEEKNTITWIQADYMKANLFKGVEVRRVAEEFDNYIKLISNIDIVIKELKNRNIEVIIVTAGPYQVAEVIKKRYGFDKAYGSAYEVCDGIFTGKIVKHLGDDGKLESVMEYCEGKYELSEVVSIGDSASDIKVFEKSGKSIAINYTSKLIDKADVYLRSDDLCDILKHIDIGLDKNT